VLPASRICDLLKSAALGNSALLFNGEILADSLPFSSYGNKDTDIIVVVPVSPRAPDRRLHLTRHSESFHEQIQFVLGEDTPRETATIRDILFTKIEQKSKTYRRLCADIQHAPARAPAPVAALNTRANNPLPAGWARVGTEGRSRRRG
jgi:hypothetical protein